MERLRRFLRRPVSVAAIGELGLWLVIPYLLLGGTRVVWHWDIATDWQQRWSQVMPAAGELFGLLFTTALWPALLLLPSSCPVV